MNQLILIIIIVIIFLYFVKPKFIEYQPTQEDIQEGILSASPSLYSTVSFHFFKFNNRVKLVLQYVSLVANYKHILFLS